ncbi:MAG: hydroxyacylglutathione hydrolase [Pseudomonadota bacterium]
MPALSNVALFVTPVPAFDDNYLWLVHDDVNAIVIDPGAAAPVVAALAAQNLTLVAILLTHHHVDHVGGVPALLQKVPVPVYGPRHEAINGVTQLLSQGDNVVIPALNLSFSILDVPGHTRGHIAYVARERPWLFCGDTLFAGGCGRLFEGTAAQMAASLAKLEALPDQTQIYCAHEYTLANLRFALAIEPKNQALQSRIQVEQAKRDAGIPTIPSSLALEKATNPFLRCREAAIIKLLQSTGRLQGNDPIATFAALREWKNTFH